MPPFDAPDGVRARVEDRTLVVTVGDGASLDRVDARHVNRGFVHALAEYDVNACLTVLREDPDADVFEEVERAAAAGVSQDISRWAVVLEGADDGAAFAEHVTGIETRIFEDESRALAWTNDA